MTSRERIARRRATARRLYAEGVPVNEIARKLGVSHSIISRDLKVEPPTDGPPPPPKGNQRNRRSGVWSEAAVAPVRERLAARLSAEYPWVSADEIAIQAQRLAQMELVGRFTDENGVVRDGAGRVYDAADRLTSWARASEAFYDRARKAQPVGWRAPGDPGEARAAAINASDPVAVELARALAGRSGAEIAADPELSAISRDFLRHLAARDAGKEAPPRERREPTTTAGALEGDAQRQLNPGPLDPDPLDPLGGLRNGR